MRDFYNFRVNHAQFYVNGNTADFPFSADERAEPRPDMNIKVTAFTETKKLHYTRISAHVFVSIVFTEEGDRFVDVYVNLLTCITDMYIIVNGYYI